MKRVISWLLVGCSALIVVAAQAQDDGWPVPEQFAAMKNPVAASPEVIATGKQLYAKNCLRCHGEAGLGDGPATKFIRPAPKDITSAAMQDRNSDGTLFYKITEGKKPMPPMKTTLSDEQRWQIVHFVRTLRK